MLASRQGGGEEEQVWEEVGKYPLFHYLWAVKQLQSLSLYHTTLQGREWTACVVAALECMGVEATAPPHRLLEFLEHGSGCSATRLASRLPLGSDLLHCSTLAGDLARIVRDGSAELPYGLLQCTPPALPAVPSQV